MKILKNLSFVLVSISVLLSGYYWVMDSCYPIWANLKGNMISVHAREAMNISWMVTIPVVLTFLYKRL